MSEPMPGSGAARLKTVATRDIDEQAALLHGWNQTYNQMSGGAFAGELSEAEFGGLYLFREKTSTSLHQVGELPADRIAVGVPLSIPRSGKFCGETCDGNQAHVFSGANGFEFQTPNGLDMAGLVIPLALFKTVLMGEEWDMLPAQVRSARLAPIDPAARDRFRQLFIGALETLQTGTCTASPALGKAFASDAARAIIDCLSLDGGEPALPLSQARCRMVVHEAERLILESTNDYLTIEEICQTLEISRRTLQTCFHRALGMRPATYLRLVRLNAARRTLKEGRSVTEAATAWGFWHFGRFAHDYKAMFGEHPSLTARRHAPRRQ